jgi:TPR repeat protein
MFSHRSHRSLVTIALALSACQTTKEVAKDDEPVAAQVLACDEKIVVACVDLAGRAERGDGMKKDLDRALDLRTRACEGGHAESCEWVARHHEEKGQSASTTEFLEKACREGDDLSCVRAASMMFDGPKNAAEKSAELFTLSCERGHAASCTGQGMHVSTGKGLPQNDESARLLFDKGCKGGDMQGCTNLAFLLESGRGGFPDDEGAGKLYRNACTQKNGAACFNLGVRLRKTGLGARDGEAAAFFDQACGLGEGQGCAEIAWHHLKGRGVARDPVRAKAFAERACAQNVDAGCRMVSMLEQNPEGL